MKKNIVIALLVIGILGISYLFKLNFVYVLMITTLCIVCFYYLNTFFSKEEEEKFIEQKLVIANKEIIKAPNTVILIVKDNKVVWCNDLSYSEFPILKEDRSIKNIGLDNVTDDNTFVYNQQIYQVKADDGVYFIQNVTSSQRYLRSLENKQTNIAILTLDNYQYLEEQLSRENFGSVIRDLRVDLLRFFDQNNIFYQEFEGEKYQLLIPAKELRELIDQRFAPLFDLFKKYITEEYTISYSMGIAFNQPNVRATGYKAMEALDLAISRGGAQTIIFDGDKRIIFGGGTNVIQGSTLMKARLMHQTLMNIIKYKQHIYLMGHKHPDSDCIGAMVLMYQLIRNKYNMPITLLIDEEHQDLIKKLIKEPKDLIVSSTCEVSAENNLLLIVDTQAQNYVSNPESLKLINDIVIIDHHQAPDDLIKNPVTKWVEPSLSSVIEMILQMFAVSQTKLGSKALATYALYGMLIDTNYLTYRVSETTLDMVKRLVNNGGDMLVARKLTFDDFDQFKLLNTLASNVIKVNCFSVVNTEFIDDHVILSKVADSILEIKDVKASIVISNVDYQYIVKVRSMGDINAKLFIEEFGGGGHATQAAGILNHDQYIGLMNKIKTYEE